MRLFSQLWSGVIAEIEIPMNLYCDSQALKNYLSDVQTVSMNGVEGHAVQYGPGAEHPRPIFPSPPPPPFPIYPLYKFGMRGPPLIAQVLPHIESCEPSFLSKDRYPRLVESFPF